MTRKKLLTIAVPSLVGVAIIAALIFLYVTVWSQPTKKDFAEAKALAEKIKMEKPSVQFKAFVAAISTSADANKTYDEIVDASKDEKAALIDTLNRRSEYTAKLEKSRTLKDDVVKKAFTKYIEKEKASDTFFRNYADSYAAYNSSFFSCDKIYHISDQINDNKDYAKKNAELSVQCLKELNILATGTFKPFADFGKEYTRILHARQAVFDGYAVGKISDADALKTIKQLGAETKKNDPNDALMTLQNKSILNGELTALIELLGKKADQAK